MFALHRGRRRPATRSFLMIFIFAAMLLAPVGDQIAMAQVDDAPPAEEAEDPVQPTEEPALDQPPITEVPLEGIEDPGPPTEIPEDDAATEEPATEVPAPEMHRLTIDVYRCDHPEFDPYFSGNIQMVFDQCTGPGYGTFTAIIPRSELTQSGSALEFEIFGDLAVWETLQPGYENPIANCFLYDLNGNLADQIGPGDAGDGLWKVGGIRGDVHCDWYQVDRGIGNVYIVNMACPATAGLFPQPTMSELVTMCTLPAGAKQFFVEHGPGLTRMGVSGGEFNDVLLEAIQTGPIEIWMDEPATFESARVFCQANTLEGVEISPFAEVAVSDFRATGVVLAHGQRLHCSWFNLSEGPGLAQPDDLGEAGQGAVAINAHACPAAFDAYSADIFEIAANCHDDPGSVNFTVSSGAYSQTAAATGGGNYASFSDVPGGAVTVTEELPAGYGAPVVFCKVELELDLSDILPTALIPVDSGPSISMPLGDGHLLWCDWYNVPLSSQSQLTIVKHTCPPGYDPLAPGVNPMLDCAATINGVNFTLTDDDPDTVDLQTMTGDAIDGAARFGGLAPGDYTATETVPEGIATIFVLGCGGGGGIDPIPTVIDGSLEIGIPQGVLLTCHWFNVPEVGGQQGIARVASPEASPGVLAALGGTASLTMYKYVCPAGFDVSTVDANPQAMCTLTDGYSFEMDDTIDDNGSWVFETGISGTGYSTIDGLGADTYSIVEGVKNGTTATFVWDCYDLSGSSSRTDPLAIGNQLIYELGDGAQVRCDWFNVTGGTARVIVNKHACDVLIPAYTLTREELAAQCTADPGTINFTIVSGAHQETLPASQTPLVLASFANVPSGYMAVVEDIPAGWSDPIVYCEVSLEDATAVSPPALMNLQVGRQISFALEPGQVMFCDWYNVTAGFVDVHITKYACPAGFDAYAADLTTLVVTCTADPGTVEFSLEDGGLYYQERSATAAIPAVWEDVPSGKIRVNETLPDGYGLPVVICRVDFEDGSNVLPAAPVALAGSTWIWPELSAGQVLHCEWFNVPGGLGMVSMWKQACPAGFDAYTATHHELETFCNEDIETIGFTLTSGSFSQTASSTNLFRFADFWAVPAGMVTVTETLPATYGTPVVFCRVQETGQPVTPNEKVTVGGDTSITWPLEHDQWLICDWYNVQYEETTGDNGRVVNYKRFCPEDVDVSSPSLEELEQACPEIRGGIPFTVSNADGFSRTAVTSGQTGVAIVENVPPSEVIIQETIPDGFGEPIVFCDSLPRDQRAFADIPLAQILASDGVIAYTVEPRAEVHCHWFNIPSTGNSVTVIKYECPEGAPYDEDNTWYEQNCTQPHDGIEFKLTHAEGASTMTTAGGQAQWTDLPLGPFSIQEYIPAEYGEPVVFCFAGSDVSLAQLVRMEVTGGYLESDLTVPRTFYTCHWYNMPGGPGEITVHKYTCPEGYDLHAAGADPQADCTEATDGVTFTLGGAAAQVQAATSDGMVTFGELAPGPYTVIETVPADTWYVFVLDCYGQRMGELRPYPLAMGDTLDIHLSAGESVVCSWYNVPEYDPDFGRLTVYKYDCGTLTFISEIDCEVYEDGQEFDLVFWNGAEWEYRSTGTTDGVGKYTWIDLTPGEYWLDEQDRDWCQMTSEQLSDNGNWLNVYDDQETIVTVYNCSSDPGEQGKPGETPAKYPNTGVPPMDSWPARETP